MSEPTSDELLEWLRKLAWGLDNTRYTSAIFAIIEAMKKRGITLEDLQNAEFDAALAEEVRLRTIDSINQQLLACPACGTRHLPHCGELGPFDENGDPIQLDERGYPISGLTPGGTCRK